MRIKSATRERIRLVTGFAVALAIGAVLAVAGFLLPPALQRSGVERVEPELRPVARTALRDVEQVFFDDGVEQLLVTLVYVDSIAAGPPPPGCPERSAYHARVRARTAWWIPYDDVLWCGNEAGAGIFVTRQS